MNYRRNRISFDFFGILTSLILKVLLSWFWLKFWLWRFPSLSIFHLSPSYHCLVSTVLVDPAILLNYFTDPLLVWTYYYSSTPSSLPSCTDIWITRETWMHTLHHPLSPLLFKQRLVPHTVLTTPSSYISLLLAFRPGVFNPKRGSSNIRKHWCWLKLLYSFSYKYFLSM